MINSILGIPVIYKVAAALLSLLLLFSYGYYQGYSGQREKFMAYKADVTALAKAQELKAKEIVEESLKINKEAEDAYKRDLIALRAEYDRLRLGAASPSPVPPVPQSPEGTNGDPKDRLPSLPSDCAETTLQLTYLQEWIREQAKQFNRVLK